MSTTAAHINEKKEFSSRNSRVLAAGGDDVYFRGEIGEEGSIICLLLRIDEAIRSLLNA